MTHSPTRHGGVTSALLALLVVLLLAVLAVVLVPGLKDLLFHDSKPAETATASPAVPEPSQAHTPVRLGAITAVRAKEGLPTFCLVAVSDHTPAMGTTLQAMRNGQTRATLVLELVSAGNLTCRVTTWAAGASDLAVGDVVEQP